MSEVALTLEGWYVYHDFRTIDWQAWKKASQDERQVALTEFADFCKDWPHLEENKEGTNGIYVILGHKADLVFMHLRPSLEALHDLKHRFNKSRFAAFTRPSHSYISVVELSNYVVGSKHFDPDTDPEVQRRLKPVLPKTPHVCFYPMNKRRDAEYNWYMLSMEERRNMMRSHGMIGRKYAGKVTQIISGSVGFDDWEWGVTLFAEDALVFKKLIYEMRFDAVSARYSDFGSFFVGNRIPPEHMGEFMKIESKEND